MNKVAGTALFLGLFGSIANANATTILYNDFSDLSGLTLNGKTAALNPNSDNYLRLTSSTSQSGSAFSTNAISLQNNASFSTAFSFNISHPSGIGDSDGQGADGLTFALQTDSNTAGGSGGGIGYAGIPHSVAIEFDTYNNGAADLYDGNHVGVDLNGSVTSAVQTHVDTRMNNSQDWYAWVDYNGDSNLLEVRLAEVDLRPLTALLAYNVDLPTILGNNNLAYAGFTSGTGSGGGQHDILNWQFNSSYSPIARVGTVPAPATIVLMLTGLFTLQKIRRRTV